MANNKTTPTYPGVGAYERLCAELEQARRRAATAEAKLAQVRAAVDDLSNRAVEEEALRLRPIWWHDGAGWALNEVGKVLGEADGG
jgi:hypothetical protein